MTKRKKLSQFKDYSVIQQDSFDKRRFTTIMEMSKSLQQLDKKVSKEMEMFRPLLGDIWASLYKAKPTIKDEIEQESVPNKAIMERLMSEESFEDTRSQTKLDDLFSAMTSLKYGEQTYEWLLEQKEQNERVQELLDQIQQAQKNQSQQQGDGQSQQGTGDSQQQGNGQGQPQMTSLESLMQELGNELQKGMNKSFFDNLEQVSHEVDNTIQSVKSLVGGSAGSGDAQFKQVPLREKIELAEMLSSNPKLKRIAQWAGRMKTIADKKQKSAHKESGAKSGMKLGNDIRLLVPTELALYRNDVTRKDFLRRFLEKQTLQYEPRGKDKLGKGPIVCCMDQSSSMNKADDASKAFVLSLMMIARKQKRDFCFIPFSNRAQSFEYKKGKMQSRELLNFAQMFLGGGTNFHQPLRAATEVIEKSRYKKADIIFVTDGEANVSSDFLKNFKELKAKKDFKVLSIVFSKRHNATVTCELFSDKVVKVEDYHDENCFEAFEI